MKTSLAAERLRGRASSPPGSATALVIGVAGAGGGSGASVFAAAVSVRAAAAGWLCCLVDGDRYGGGLDVLMAVEHLDGPRWHDLVHASGTVDGPALLELLPRGEDVAVLSHGRDAQDVPDEAAAVEVIQGLAGAVELVVVDLPRADTTQFAAVAAAVDTVILVCRPDLRGTAAAVAVARAVTAHCPSRWICFRGRPRELSVGSVAEALGLQQLTIIPDEPSLDSDVTRGLPPGSRGRSGLSRAADAALSQVLGGSPHRGQPLGLRGRR